MKLNTPVLVPVCAAAVAVIAPVTEPVTTNVAPTDMAEMCSLALAGDIDGAKAIDQKLSPIHNKLFVEANPIPVKWACAELGLIPNAVCRLPLTTLSEQYWEVVRNALKEAKLF